MDIGVIFFGGLAILALIGLVITLIYKYYAEKDN
jgi:hypothetical protein